ncbi:MAG: hypothetical protein D4R64_05025 [Porphyromonadaceae bacterium]|nr:MAG: hypothetical protein D4R64_05025 [Porphyromonadaceae bacterium]
MTGKDPFSGQAFTKKSETQRFSSRENQIKYNNRKATERRRTLSDYWKVLTRNRDILNRTLGDKAEHTVSRDFLIGAGYDFMFFTHTGIQLADKVMGVFEYGLKPLSGDRYKVIRFRNRPVLDEATFNPSNP